MRGSKGLGTMLVDASCSLLGMGSRMWTFSLWNDGVSLRGVWSLRDAGTAKHSEGARELLQAHGVFTVQIESHARPPT